MIKGKEASGLRLSSSVLYTQGVRGSSPLPPTISSKSLTMIFHVLAGGTSGKREIAPHK
jgi:hypothetical protein